jgi:hypothetical protein
VEQNRSPRYKYTQLCHLIFDTGAKKYNGEKTVSSTNVARKTGYLPAGS